MGVNGIWNALRTEKQKKENENKEIGLTETNNVVELLKGKCVGVDAMSWLFEAIYEAKSELPTVYKLSKEHIAIIQTKLDALLHHGITPVLVIDGARIPLPKVDISFNDKAPLNLWEAKVSFMEAFMEYAVMSPYEADSQLAYMLQNNMIGEVISEDFDLILYGCKRIFKIKKGSLAQNKEKIEAEICTRETLLKSGFFKGFDGNQMLSACILAGCTYAPNVPGIGIMTSKSLILKYKSYADVIHELKARKGLLGGYRTIKAEHWSDNNWNKYLEKCDDAFVIYQFAWAFDPQIKKLCPLKMHNKKESSIDAVRGFKIGDHDALEIYKGNLDPYNITGVQEQLYREVFKMPEKPKKDNEQVSKRSRMTKDTYGILNFFHKIPTTAKKEMEESSNKSTSLK